LNKAYGDVI